MCPHRGRPTGGWGATLVALATARTRVLVAPIVCALALCGQAAPTAAQQWTASWGSSLQSVSPDDWTLTDASIRLIARSTIAGERMRVRLENTFGEEPLRIGAGSVALQSHRAALVPGSSRPLRFGGSDSVTIPAGDHVVSDPVSLPVQAEQRIAVSLFVPGSGVRSSMHANGLTTSYVTTEGAGDRTASVQGESYTRTTTSMHWLSAIEVFSTSARGAIVAFGDSITDGSCATVDGYDRWEDVLYSRLVEAAGRADLAMVNAGIGGNTVIRVPPVGSPPGVERLDRDVLSLAGVTHVVLFLGTNDLRRDASAAHVIAGLGEIVDRVKARGVKVIGVTIIPRNPVPRGLPANLGFTAARNAGRREINEWIRSQDALDAVFDFDAVVKDTTDSDLINPMLDCDGIHPNVLGYGEMGRSVDLDVFELP